MSGDILSRIDEVMAANARRFDPLGEAWDDNRVERVDDGMRVRQPGGELDGNVPIPLNDDGSRFAMNSRPGLFSRPEPGSPWLTLEDISGRPDRVGDALRAEVLRQGLSECEVDGQPWQYRDGRWEQLEALRSAQVAEIARLYDVPLAFLDGTPPARRPWWKRWPW